MASEEMQGWYGPDGQKLKVFSPIIGEGGIWNNLDQCSSNAGPRPGTGPWHQLYRAARGFSWNSSF